MSNDDLELFINLAADTERHVAGMTRDDRSAMISSLIRAANVVYGVWAEGYGYRLRLIRSVEPPGEEEVLAGIPVQNEQHAALLAAAAAHARDAVARELHGEFARLNFVDDAPPIVPEQAPNVTEVDRPPD